MVTAQQEINRMRARGGGQDEYYDHRSGGAAAAALSEMRWPKPSDLVIGDLPGSLGLAARKPHRRSTSFRPWRVVPTCAIPVLIDSVPPLKVAAMRAPGG
jgi:hypothetical protein